MSRPSSRQAHGSRGGCSLRCACLELGVYAPRSLWNWVDGCGLAGARALPRHCKLRCVRSLGLAALAVVSAPASRNRARTDQKKTIRTMDASSVVASSRLIGVSGRIVAERFAITS